MSIFDFSKVFDILKQAWSAVYGWFSQLMFSTSAWGYIFICILAMLVIRFIVYPALKPSVGSSDSVRSSNSRKPRGISYYSSTTHYK